VSLGVGVRLSPVAPKILSFKVLKDMNLNNMFAEAKKINSYNDKLQKILQPPLNQLKIVQIIENKAIFIAENQAILTLAKNNYDNIFDVMIKNLSLNIHKIDFKIANVSN
jgi:hypothetical protein